MVRGSFGSPEFGTFGNFISTVTNNLNCSLNDEVNMHKMCKSHVNRPIDPLQRSYIIQKAFYFVQTLTLKKIRHL